MAYRRLNKIKELNNSEFLLKRNKQYVHTHTQTTTRTNASTIRKYDKEQDLVQKNALSLVLKREMLSAFLMSNLAD